MREWFHKEEKKLRLNPRFERWEETLLRMKNPEIVESSKHKMNKLSLRRQNWWKRIYHWEDTLARNNYWKGKHDRRLDSCSFSLQPTVTTRRQINIIFFQETRENETYDPIFLSNAKAPNLDF
jgi:hypothetical protein